MEQLKTRELAKLKGLKDELADNRHKDVKDEIEVIDVDDETYS